MNKKIILVALNTLCLGLSTTLYAQTFEPGSTTRQTIHTNTDGSTTITTVVQPPQLNMQMRPVNHPANHSMPAPTVLQQESAPADNTHYHFGSQKPQNSSPALQPAPASAYTKKPMRYENVRQDPEDVMMQILSPKNPY